MSKLKPCSFCGDPMEGNITDSEMGFARGIDFKDGQKDS